MKNIVIVGSNATGWTAALFLAKNLQGLNINITVVDCQEPSGNIAATSAPSTNAFYQILGLDLKELMCATHATFNLGTQYKDWNALGDEFVIPYTPQGISKGLFDFQQLFVKSQKSGNSTVLNEYSLPAMAAKSGKFTFPNFENNSLFSTLAFGLNVDVVKYRDYLETKAKSNGVKKFTVKISGIAQNNKGEIEKLLSNSGMDIPGDFFIDCSGEKKLLIGNLIKEDNNETNAASGCDKLLIAAFDNENEKLKACSEFTPHSCGYKKTIPLQGSKAILYAYSSQFQNDDEAKSNLLAEGNILIGDVIEKKIDLASREQFWINNCLAIGESAQSIEPLEIGMIQLIQNALNRFINLFPNKTDFTNANQYNRLTKAEYSLVSDYHKLPFVLNQRNDSEFWKNHRESSISKSLQHAIDLFKSHGRQPVYEESLIEKHRWVSVFFGFGLNPASYHPLIDMLDAIEMDNQLSQVKSQVSQAVNSMPNHNEFIQRFCLNSYS